MCEAEAALETGKLVDNFIKKCNYTAHFNMGIELFCQCWNIEAYKAKLAYYFWLEVQKRPSIGFRAIAEEWDLKRVFSELGLELCEIT